MPAAEPLTSVRYPVTATLSVDEAQVKDTLVRVTPDTTRPVGCDGGAVSADGAGVGGGGVGVGVGVEVEHAEVAALALAGGDAFPAASRATTSYR